MNKVFKYRADIQEIPHIRRDLEQLETEWNIPDSEMRQIGVIVEEIFSNIVRFAYRDDLEHVIEIGLILGEDQVMIWIADDGIPFNPLEYNPGPAMDPAAAHTGGMGLTLVSTFSDSIVYRREEGKNCLEITKMIKTRPGPGD
jgi:anti-sigma regulatory factor (Ser/Thr protein kinase)